MSKFLDYTGLQDLINKIKTALSSKQDTLISGTNIKTINSTSLLGSGNIAVQPTLVSGTNIKTINNTSLLGSGNITVGNVVGDGVSSIVSLTQSEYEALSTKDSATLYIVTPDAGPTNYLKLSGTTFSVGSTGNVIEIGSGFDTSDLANNPPIIYDANGNDLNDLYEDSVYWQSITVVNISLVMLKITFTYSDGEPVSYSVSSNQPQPPY